MPYNLVDNKPGRMLYYTETDSWEFEAGNFCQNHLCNLRVMTLLENLGGIKSAETKLRKRLIG